MHFDRIVDNSQHWLVRVRPQALTHSWLHAAQVVAGVSHGQLLNQVCTGDPCREVYDLFSVEVDDSEVLAFFDFPRVSMACFDYMSFGRVTLALTV